MPTSPAPDPTPAVDVPVVEAPVVDVLVVGGGPAGAAAATVLARAGRQVLLVDKATFPRDKCCGDGLTTGALRRLEQLGLDPADVPSWQWVDDVMIADDRRPAIRFALPDGPGRFAAVATRVDLDAAVLSLARAAGARVEEGTSLVAIEARPDAADPHVAVRLEGAGGARTVRAAHVIAADGMWSPTRKLLAAPDPTQPATAGPYLGEWHAYRQYFSNVHTEESKRLWVWFERDLLPGYLWCFPLADGRVNVGFGIERTPDVATRTMKAQWASLLELPHVRAVLGPDAVAEGTPKAWPIPCNVTSAPLTHGRVLFVGDAARVGDTLTGEGIGQALQTGMLAAESLLAFPGDTVGAARRYEDRVRWHLVPDHRMALALQRMMRSTTVARGAIAISGASDWTRRNFVRWLFEDYARGIALTPARWRRGTMSGPGTYRHTR